jgi:hypothetical protein
MIDHHVMIDALPPPRLADALRLGMNAQVYMGKIHPEEERLAGLLHPIDEIRRARRNVVVDRFHALTCQRTGILDGLPVDTPEAGSTVGSSTVLALQSSTPRGPNPFLKFGNSACVGTL